MRAATIIVMVLYLLSFSLASWSRPAKEFHPKHQVKVWTRTYKYKGKKRIYRIIQLPRCEHLQTAITYYPISQGETVNQAKIRNNAVAACTASFMNPKNCRAVDFLRIDGQIIVGKEVGRPFLAIDQGQGIISNDYNWLKNDCSVDAAALGQMLEPFQFDGFTVSFSNKITDRMGIGLTKHYIYIVQGKTDLWMMSRFFKEELKCDFAINTDGGHVVKGKSRYHAIFYWKKNSRHE